MSCMYFKKHINNVGYCNETTKTTYYDTKNKIEIIKEGVVLSHYLCMQYIARINKNGNGKHE